ncbi:MAG: recombinase family protein [Myxococcales bacterium]|nr:recombinase family protein [Myxococcales bacterium]
MSAERITLAVGYLRVEGGSQRQREGNIYIQRQAIFRYAKINGIRIARFFADHACISDITMRQGLSDAMEWLAAGKASALVLASLPQLTDSDEDLRRFVAQHRLLADGPALLTVAEGLDTRTADGRLRLAAAQICIHGELGGLTLGA